MAREFRSKSKRALSCLLVLITAMGSGFLGTAPSYASTNITLSVIDDEDRVIADLEVVACQNYENSPFCETSISSASGEVTFSASSFPDSQGYIGLSAGGPLTGYSRIYTGFWPEDWLQTWNGPLVMQSTTWVTLSVSVDDNIPGNREFFDERVSITHPDGYNFQSWTNSSGVATFALDLAEWGQGRDLTLSFGEYDDQAQKFSSSSVSLQLGTETQQSVQLQSNYLYQPGTVTLEVQNQQGQPFEGAAVKGCQWVTGSQENCHTRSSDSSGRVNFEEGLFTDLDGYIYFDFGGPSTEYSQQHMSVRWAEGISRYVIEPIVVNPTSWIDLSVAVDDDVTGNRPLEWKQVRISQPNGANEWANTNTAGIAKFKLDSRLWGQGQTATVTFNPDSEIFEPYESASRDIQLMGLSEARVDLRTRYTIEPGLIPVKVLMYDQETGRDVPQSGVLVEGCYYSRNWTEVCSSSTSDGDGLANFTFPGDSAAMNFMNFRAGGPETSYIRSSSGTELDQGRIRNVPTLHLRSTEWIQVSVAVDDNIVGNAPISNERVSLFMGDSDYARETQRTDDSGVATFLLESTFWSGELITAEVGNEDSAFTQVRGEVALQEDSEGSLSGSTSLVVDRLLFSMSGTVTDVNGSAFENRSLCLITVKNGNWIRRDITTDYWGDYIADGLTSRDVRIEPDSCDRDYFEPLPYDETPALSFVEGQGHQNLNIALTQTKLVITVTHSSPALPAAHVPIMLVPEDQWEYCASATYCGSPTALSDQNGIATFYGLQPETKYIVMFRHSNTTAGISPSNLMNLRFAEKTDSSLVEIAEANNSYSHSLSLELLPGALETPVTVSGTILGVFENLLSNVKVYYSVSDSVTHSRIMSGMTRTGENGTFSISQLAHGNISLEVSHRGFQYFHSGFSTVPGTNDYEEGDFYLRESLAGNLSYSGTLRDDAGNPLANHGLRLYGYSFNSPTTFNATTDSAGEFSFQNLPDGYYHLSPRDWTNEYEWNGWSFELIESVENSTLFLTRANNSPENRQGKLTGQVTEYVDSEGPESARPVAGTCVRVHEVTGGVVTRATTDANGVWQISGLKDDQDYSLSLTSCDEGSWESDFDFENTYERLPYAQVVRATLGGETVHEIKLKQISRPGPGEITGRVRSASTYTNLEGIKVSLYRHNGGAVIESVFTDERGEYSLVNLPLGDYSIDVEDTRDSQDPYMSWSAAVEIGLEANRLNVLLELEQTVDITDPEESPGEVSGRVFDEYGHAVRNGWVMFWDPEDPFIGGYGTTDKLGQFTVRGLPLGTPLKYKISAPFEETAYTIGEFTLTEGSVFGDKYLEHSGEITGRVSGEDPGVFAQLIHVDAESFSQSIIDSTWVNRDSGLFRFKQVPEGSYFVKISQQWEVPGLAGLYGDGGYYGDVPSVKPVYWNDTSFGAAQLVDAMPVWVPSGSRVNGINFELSPGASISGSVMLSTPDGEVPLTGSREVTVNLYHETSDGRWKKANTGFTHIAGPYSEYKFSIPGLAAGKYKLEFIDSRSGNNSLARSFNGGAASLAQAEPIVLGATQHETFNQIMRIAPPQASAQALDLDEIEASLLAQLEDEITITGQVTPGDSLSIFVGPEFAGQFVSAFANSTPTTLGDWKQVDSSGYITATIPATLPAGLHRIAVQDSRSTVFGWAPIRIEGPEATAPGAPVGLVVSNLAGTGLTLSWQPPSSNGGADITDYKIEFSSDNGATWSAMSREASNTLSFNVTGLLPLKSYQFKVSAINARGAGPASSVVSATTVAAAPSAPGSVKATSISSSGAALSWKKPTDTGGARVTNYKVETSRDNGNSWQVVRKKVSTSTKLTLSGLFAGTTYIVRVSAKNSAGFGTTAQISFKTRAGAPSAPTNLRSSSVTGTKAVITWDLPASNGGKAIKNYRVEISSNCSTYTVLRRTASNSLVQTVTKLKPRTQYCFRVSTITSLGTSEASKVLKIKTKARN